ncbi:MAG: hypothetical protein ABSH53_23400 [Holophaga sp.]
MGQGGPQDPGHLLDLAVQVQGLDLELALPGIGQDLGHQGGGPVDQLLQGPVIQDHRRGIFGPLRRFQAAQHGSEQVVEIVGNASGQDPEGFQLLGLQQGPFRLFPLGDVGVDQAYAPAGAVLVHQGELVRQVVPQGAVRPRGPPFFHLDLPVVPDDLLVPFPQGSANRFGEQVLDGPAEDLGGRQPDLLFHPGVDVQEPAIQTLERDGGRRVLDEPLQLGFALVPSQAVPRSG